MRDLVSWTAIPLMACAAFMMIAQAHAGGITSPKGHEAVKAKVVNDTPEQFTINVKTLANMGVDDNADTFAMYTTGDVPKRCGDFSDISLSYKKPDKYTRVFNLSDKPEILKALDSYGCVVIPNKPSQS